MLIYKHLSDTRKNLDIDISKLKENRVKLSECALKLLVLKLRSFEHVSTTLKTKVIETKLSDI